MSIIPNTLTAAPIEGVAAGDFAVVGDLSVGGDLLVRGGSPWFDVGAFGEGVYQGTAAVDTPAIQAALADAIAAPGGGRVVFNGPLLLNAALPAITADGVQITGSGRGSVINRASGYPAATPMISALGRQGIVLDNFRLGGGDLVETAIEISGPVVGNPLNQITRMFLGNFTTTGIKLGVVGTTSFSQYVGKCVIGMTNSGSSVGIESNSSDNKVEGCEITGYSVAAIKINSGQLATYGYNELGPGALRSAAPFPTAILVKNGGIHSVGDYFDWNRQNHIVTVQPDGGQSVQRVVIEDAKALFDCLTADGAQGAADLVYSFVRADDTNGTIDFVDVLDCVLLGTASTKRLKGFVSLSSVNIDSRVLGNRGSFVNFPYDTAGSSPVERARNVFKQSSTWVRSSNAFAGTATGNGVATTFNLPHGMGTTPNRYVVKGRTQASEATFWVSSVDATNIVLTYAVAPVNLASLSWSGVAEV